jgi:hypothetical protein
MSLRSRRDKPVELDEKTRARIVSLYRDYGLTLADIRKRYRLGETRLKAILAEGGVKVVERNRRPQAEALDV